MEGVSTADARKNLAELINRVAYGKERVVLTRHGKDLCALVPLDDLGLLERLHELADARDVSDALDEGAEGRSIAWKELRREMGLDG